MKSGILLLFITTAFFTFSQVESKEVIPAEQKSKIVTQKEIEPVNYSVETKKEPQSLTTHPFFEKRNEYIAHIIEVDKKIIPTYRTTETSSENLNRLIKWAYKNKNLFESSYQEVIDKDYKSQ